MLPPRNESGICLTTKGEACYPGGIVNAVHVLNAALLLAVRGGHRWIVQPNACERADLLFRADKRDWGELQRSIPWYDARCNPRRFMKPSSLCGAQWRVPPDMLSPESSLRELPMPVEEVRAHFSSVSCNDPDFVLNGEKATRCLGANMALSDMPLRKLKAQMVCGVCRAKSLSTPCRTVIAVPTAALLPHPDYSETRMVLRSRFQATMNARGLSPQVEALLAEASEGFLVVALHMPFKEKSGAHLADGASGGHDRLMGLSWWAFGLDQVLTHVHGWCVRVHVFSDEASSSSSSSTKDNTTEADAGFKRKKTGTAADDPHGVERERHQGELAALRQRFPGLSLVVHGSEVPEQDALVAMARAHVLLAGTSAVSRLAAVLSRGVVLAPGGVPLRPLAGLRAVIVVYDHRFWDRSEGADHEFWEGRSDIVSTSSRLMQLFLAQRHPVPRSNNKKKKIKEKTSGPSGRTIAANATTTTGAKAGVVDNEVVASERGLNRRLTEARAPAAGASSSFGSSGEALIGRCLRVAAVTNCKLRFVKGQTSVQCT